ncbi:type VI secretion protein [Streptomyces bohaiensis]|uniref:type VI secretion protein n=1 Tax=Streptomyces bohaiensis TaxID=1431344 RepID=UPI003B7C2E48
MFRADTGQAAGLYPFLHSASLPPIGVYMGWDVHTQQAFSAHPSAWVAEGLATNPNVMITGIPGSGKSAHIKALCLRMMALGHRALIAGDLKGEYAGLCEYLGTQPVRLGPGLPGRLNPLDAGPLGETASLSEDERSARITEVRRRRLTLLGSLLALQLRRPLAPAEEEVLRVALAEVTGELSGSSAGPVGDPTLPDIHRVLTDPTAEMARALRVRDGDLQSTREQMATMRATLGNMIDGHLGGIFDAPTSISLDWDAPIQSIDISSVDKGYPDETVAMILTCVSSWAQSATDQPGRPWIVVRDELWRQISSGGTAMVAKLDSDLRLSRNTGTTQVMATHRLSDFEGADAAAARVAKHLISSCATRITLAQDTTPLAATKEAIGLTDAECALINSWGAAQRGRALWRVDQGTGSYAVQLVLSELEARLFHTDERMAR